jgi:hydrogenase maturation protein HypF
VLALGADLKNTVALGFDDRVVISPHIGDLGSLRSEQIFERVIDDLLSLYGCSAERVVCDAHPDYRSARWARSRTTTPTRVYHHHAHASALAGEFGLFDPMLVFTWDGVGYGEDGTLWGGEALLGQPGSWRRVGTLRRFRLPGGERASREPWRCAWSLCWETGLGWPDGPLEAGLLRDAWSRGLNSPHTHSVGRLFDAAAALIGIAATTNYEAQAAMQLENLAKPSPECVPLPVHPCADGIWTIDWGPMIAPLMNKHLRPSVRASLFHSSLATSIVTLAERVREEHGLRRIGLTGGVFQNRLLTEQTVERLQALDFDVFLPAEIPCNDAGIAYGQIIEAGARGAAESSA